MTLKRVSVEKVYNFSYEEFQNNYSKELNNFLEFLLNKENSNLPFDEIYKKLISLTDKN